MYLFIHIYDALLGILKSTKVNDETDIFTVLMNVQGTLNKDVDNFKIKS